MDNVVTTPVPSFFIGSSSFVQVTRSTIKAYMGLKLGQIRSGTVELAALERLKKITIDLYWENCCDHCSAFIL